MATEAHAPTASEYIVHHLQHLQTVKQKSIVDFSVFNIDSIGGMDRDRGRRARALSVRGSTVAPLAGASISAVS